MAMYQRAVADDVDRRAAEPVQLTIDLHPAGSTRAGYVASATVGDRPPVSGGFEPPVSDWQPAEERAKVAEKRVSVGATDSAVQAGAQLFDALFSGSLRRCWAQTVEDARRRGVRLVIRSADLAIHALPWELLYDRVLLDQHLVLAEEWSVIRSVPEPPAAPPPRQHSHELSVLVVTPGIAGVDAEQDLAAIQSAWPAIGVEVRRGAGTAEVAEALAGQPIDVLHVASTGVELPDGRQYLALGGVSSTDPMSEAVLVSAGDLLEMVNRAPEPPRLVVLAGCDTDVLAAELAWDIPAVVGVRGAVADMGLVEFVRGFYEALGQRVSVEAGIAAGRMRQRAYASAFGADWAAPVGYLSAAQHLVVPDEEPASLHIPSPRSERAVAPSTDPTTGKVELELEMRTLDLDALRERWRLEEDQLWPELIRRHHDALTAEIAAARQELGLAQ